MNYKLHILFILLIGFSLKGVAQIDEIDLPKGDNDIKIKRFTPIFSIYVDAEDNVYLEKEPINVFTIAKKLSYLRYKLPEELKIRVKIYLYVDKRVNYNTVDLIKTQLASADFELLYYKTNSIEDKDILKGISWTNHLSFFKLQWLQKVLTDKQIVRNKRYNDSLRKIGDFDIPPPPPPMPNWYFDNRHKIYSDNQEAIDEALEGQTYTCVELTNKGFQREGEIINFGDVDKLKTLFTSFKIVFVSFNSDLIYTNYFNAISNYKQLDVKNKGFFFELSNEIEEIHKKSKTVICN